MPIALSRGDLDLSISQVFEALRAYESQHPNALIEGYRQSPFSIRLRIIDPDFSGVSRAERHESTWRFLETLSEEIQSEISLLVLLTANEIEDSFANLEFENPTPPSV